MLGPHTILRLLLGTAMLCLLVGCSNDPNPPGWSKTNTVFVGYDDPKELDPVVSYTSTDLMIVGAIYPSFWRYHYLELDPYKLELNLGAAEPTIEKTEFGERWTFRIRDDLRFQDDPVFPGGKGRKITADDFVYAFKRLADPENKSPAFAFFADKVRGWNEYSEGFEKDRQENYDKPFVGVMPHPNDPHVFWVDLVQPYPQLRYLMAMTFTSPQAREAVEHYGTRYNLDRPVGCGPYMLTEATRRQRYVLERNPNATYARYPTTAPAGTPESLKDRLGQPLPGADRIVLRVIKEPVTGYNLFLQGYLDRLNVSSANAQVVSGTLNRAERLKQQGIRLDDSPYPATAFLIFNMNDPTFGGYDEKRKKLRKAISMAVHAEPILDVLSQGADMPAQWVIPPGIPGYDPDYKNPSRTYDPELTEAKRLLAEAGYPDGIDPSTGERLELPFDNYATTPVLRQMVQLIIRQIEKLGLKVESKSTDLAKFNEKIDGGQAVFYYWSWYADYPDAENFLLLLYSPNKAPGPNYGFYANDEYDRLFEQVRGMDDTPERRELIRRMREISEEDTPRVWVSHTIARSMRHAWYGHDTSHPMAQDALIYLAVDPELRAQKQAEWNRPRWGWIPAFLVAVLLGLTPGVLVLRARRRRRVRIGGAA